MQSDCVSWFDMVSSKSNAAVGSSGFVHGKIKIVGLPNFLTSFFEGRRKLGVQGTTKAGEPCIEDA